MEGVVPDLLKIAKVIPVFKSGDEKVIMNYRPISILPVFSKIFEKVVFNRLQNYLDKNNILHHNQFGFRPNLSTSLALLQLTDEISKASDDGKITIGIFVDLAKAFDTVDHKILLKKLNHYGIRGTALNWFESYLLNRVQYVMVNRAKSRSANVICGVPQGSILGPILFLLYINDLNIVSNIVRMIMFADDTNLFLTGKSVKEIEESLNRELGLLAEWFQANLLSVNVSKTGYIIFSNKINDGIKINLHMNNLEITRQYETKFLGLILNYNLKWNKHVEIIVNKISKNIGIISKVRHLLPLGLTRTLYLTLVEPYISYCNLVWSRPEKTVLLETIHKIQKKYCRLITFSDYRAHSKPLFIQLKLLTVYQMCKVQLCLYVYKSIKGLFPPGIAIQFQQNASIHNYNTRQKLHLHIEGCRTTSRLNTIRFLAPRVWDSLPEGIKHISHVASFRRMLRTYVLSNLV